MTTHSSKDSVEADPRRLRKLRSLGILMCWLVLLFAIGSSTSWRVQGALGAAVIAVALAANRWTRSYVTSLFLVLLSCVFTARYGLWRLVAVTHLFRGAGTKPAALDASILLLLLLAELYSFLNLGLGYFQMLWPLRRAPASLPGDADRWPVVDLFIPTLNEPLEVVKYTALGALNLDWPPDRLNVYVLDDGRREELRAFCAEAGIGYMVRENNEGAKAGNLNHALERTEAPFVAVFDADHIPVRSFLQMTMGWFDRDSMLGLAQTPHHLYSPDPFERNLNQFRAMPNEGELFYGVVQDGNDLWNATYFCGTGAVLRRAALDSIGGIATETVTEDAHTSLRLQKQGWNTAYINLPLAAGLAPERLSGLIRQRRRWAKGMVQVLRLENPLFARGLTLAQRFCYFHASVHFLNAIPRLVFLTAPLMYLLLGRTTIPGYWAAVLAYGVPHLALGSLANSRLQGAHRFSFWNEVYETVLAPFLVLPAVLAFVLPKAGQFDTTTKGEVVQRGFFDTRAAWPVAVLFCANLAGLACAFVRLIDRGNGTTQEGVVGSFLRWMAHLRSGQDVGAVALNAAWVLFNLVILMVALAVARETRQRRRAVRLQKRIGAGLVFADGRWVQGETVDVSSGGLLVHCSEPPEARLDEPVNVVLSVQDQETVLPATVVEAMPRALRVRFDPLTLKEEEALAVLLYAPSDAWVGWGLGHEPDRPLRSFARIAALAGGGVLSAVRTLLAPATVRFFAFVGCLLAAGLGGLLLLPARVRAQDAPSNAVAPRRAASATAEPREAGGSVAASAVRSTEQVLRLSVLTSPGILELQGAGSSQGMHFDVGANEVMDRADLRLRYQLLGDVAGGVGALQVLLNGVVVGSVPGGRSEAEHGSGHGDWRDLTLALPPELLVHNNELLLRMSVPECSTKGCSAPDAKVDIGGSELRLQEREIVVRPRATSGSNRRPGAALPASSRGAASTGIWGEFSVRAPLGVAALRAVARLLLGVLTCCLALAFLLRAALRERAVLRLQH